MAARGLLLLEFWWLAGWRWGGGRRRASLEHLQEGHVAVNLSVQ